MGLSVHMLPILGDNYTYILVSDDEVAVVDPGVAQPVWDYLQQHNLKLTSILCTLHHGDHIAGNADLKKKSGCKIYGARKDKNKIPEMDHSLEEGDVVTVGSLHHVYLVA